MDSEGFYGPRLYNDLCTTVIHTVIKHISTESDPQPVILSGVWVEINVVPRL